VKTLDGSAVGDRDREEDGYPQRDTQDTEHRGARVEQEGADTSPPDDASL
jgi:hypothetical protein